MKRKPVIQKVARIQFVWHAEGRNIDDTIYLNSASFEQFKAIIQQAERLAAKTAKPDESSKHLLNKTDGPVVKTYNGLAFDDWRNLSIYAAGWDQIVELDIPDDTLTDSNEWLAAIYSISSDEDSIDKLFDQHANHDYTIPLTYRGLVTLRNRPDVLNGIIRLASELGNEEEKKGWK